MKGIKVAKLESSAGGSWEIINGKIVFVPHIWWITTYLPSEQQAAAEIFCDWTKIGRTHVNAGKDKEKAKKLTDFINARAFQIRAFKHPSRSKMPAGLSQKDKERWRRRKKKLPLISEEAQQFVREL